jgi:hypothetical protein
MYCSQPLVDRGDQTCINDFTFHWSETIKPRIVRADPYLELVFAKSRHEFSNFPDVDHVDRHFGAEMVCKFCM